jgi:hypothetical protein
MLTGVHYRVPWDLTDWNRAHCAICSQMSRSPNRWCSQLPIEPIPVVLTQKFLVERRRKGYEFEHQWGFYAFRDLPFLFQYNDDLTTGQYAGLPTFIVSGEVGLAGRVVVAERGYRAEMAVPLRLFGPEPGYAWALVPKQQHERYRWVTLQVFDFPVAELPYPPSRRCRKKWLEENHVPEQIPELDLSIWR